jgi:hypothetical protein
MIARAWKKPPAMSTAPGAHGDGNQKTIGCLGSVRPRPWGRQPQPRLVNDLLRLWFQKMAEAHVVAGLIAKQIEHTQDQLRQLVIDLDHIDASIHIFDPSIEVEEFKGLACPARIGGFISHVRRTTGRCASRRASRLTILTTSLDEFSVKTGDSSLSFEPHP